MPVSPTVRTANCLSNADFPVAHEALHDLSQIVFFRQFPRFRLTKQRFCQIHGANVELLNNIEKYLKKGLKKNYFRKGGDNFWKSFIEKKILIKKIVLGRRKKNIWGFI
ncbi:MAG: hypothetical protein GY821_08355 [Gammaproteobacteria bacterium]|nr:hypothetical protein [Gammaproteobacteria bacterium]